MENRIKELTVMLLEIPDLVFKTKKIEADMALALAVAKISTTESRASARGEIKAEGAKMTVADMEAAVEASALVTGAMAVELDAKHSYDIARAYVEAARSKAAALIEVLRALKE